MNRRTFLRAGAGGLAAGLAGCGELFAQQSTARIPPVLDDRPDAVYRPTHIEGMEMIGTQTVGDRTVGLFYSFPHRFWTVAGDTSLVEIQDDHSVHLMASMWDRETETVIPVLARPRFTVSADGDVVDERRAWPMLSQNMGFHFGENIELDGDGTYTVEVEVLPVDIETVDAFDGRFESRATAEFTFDYAEGERDDIAFEEFPETAGERAAVDPMDMSMPLSYAPAVDELPGSPVTVGRVGDAEFVVTVVDETLVASPRTPYNRFSVPGFSLSATIESVEFDGTLANAVGPTLGAHYRAALDSSPASGDTITVSVESPSSLSRHEGYETTFLEPGSASATL
ncbi:MAG: iron transporter [Halapricum sp.]